ncbi:MAG: tellurite methyltransferase [Alteromonadaceae bacterium]|jgi:tellurite methyltransferase
MTHSLLLERYLPLLNKANEQFPVLDLACGSGRNGLYLIKNSIQTVFSDIREDALISVKNNFVGEDIKRKNHLAQFWQIDFEQPNHHVLSNEKYTGVLVFNYLHRPLMPQIKNTVIPGGVIFYETFTTQQCQYGRPSNPDFLLKPEELLEHFSGWKIHHYFEGVVNDRNSQSKKAIAQLVAEKPDDEVELK